MVGCITRRSRRKRWSRLPPRRKSLAKSAREATQANEALDAANRKRGCLPKEVRTVSIEEAVMGFEGLKSDSDMRV